MKVRKKCNRCDEDFYASYKGRYYCSYHLEQVLTEEKRTPSNKVKNNS